MSGEVSTLPHKPKPHPPPSPKPRVYAADNIFVRSAKQAFERLIELSIFFPNYYIIKFKNKTNLEVFYWLEYITNEQISNENPEERQKFSKTHIIDLLKIHRNILLFHKNKRNHPKVNMVYSNDSHDRWLILFDEHGENETDFSSLGVLLIDIKCLLTKDQVVKFLKENRIIDSKLSKLGLISKEPTTVIQSPLRAGLLSRARHQVGKMRKYFRKPHEKSVSRTNTFTRRNRPEDYVNDPEFADENKQRIEQLHTIVNTQPSPKTGILKKFKASRKRANARALLGILRPQNQTLVKRDAPSVAQRNPSRDQVSPESSDTEETSD